jgi:Lhr-like helicase
MATTPLLMVNITEDEIIIRIATTSSGETLTAFQDAIVKLLHLRVDKYTDYSEVYYSTWLLKEMIPAIADVRC